MKVSQFSSGYSFLDKMDVRGKVTPWTSVLPIVNIQSIASIKLPANIDYWLSHMRGKIALFYLNKNHGKTGRCLKYLNY